MFYQGALPQVPITSGHSGTALRPLPLGLHQLPAWPVDGPRSFVPAVRDACDHAAADAERRRQLVALHAHTGRSTVLYASAWLQRPEEHQATTGMAMHDEDLQGLLDVCRELPGPNLDLILHSPGGYASSAAALAGALRDRFDHIRILVPLLVQSSATLLSCAGNEIWMAAHSFLGPVAPRLHVETAHGRRWVSAQDVLAQFDRAADECRDPGRLPGWIPFLRSLQPDLLARCEDEATQARTQVAHCLEARMFAGRTMPEIAAETAADWLCDHDAFVTTGRHLARTRLRELGLVVRNLEDDPELHALCRALLQAASRSFGPGGVAKIIENHEGRVFLKV